jgi:hypothetical protein
MGGMANLVGRSRTSQRVISNIDMNGLGGQICTRLLATSAAPLFTETIQRQAIRWYNTLVVNIGIIFLIEIVSDLIKCVSVKRKN